MNAAIKKTIPYRPIIFILILVSIFILANIFHLDEKIKIIRDWIKTLGILGPVVYIFVYAIAVVALIPGSALTVAAGAMFGSVIGVICVSLASTLGASLSFLIARYFARDSVSTWLNKTEKFRKLDHLTEKHGAIIVAITRLVPLFPFTLLNYGFGLTKVTFQTYVLWSWLCMLPGTILFVVGAAAFTKGLAQGQIPWLLIGVFFIILVLLVLLVRHAKNILKRKEKNTT